MNGKVHLGHGFSMTKAEFYSRYKQIKGYNNFFPIGFHGTGMPIAAAAKKLKDEINDIGLEKLEEMVELNKQKTGNKTFTQYEIMLMNHVEKNDIPKFVDAEFWLQYFPERSRSDFTSLGICCDFRRSFITTPINPFGNSFIEWQFRKLKKHNFIEFGKRPSIFTPKFNQMCADHDRKSDSEGILPQEYTLIKLKVISTKSDKIKTLLDQQRDVFLVAATLRPETMYG